MSETQSQDESKETIDVTRAFSGVEWFPLSSARDRAPDEIGVYEIGIREGGTVGTFIPKYLGKADSTLNIRLYEEYTKSHNENIKEIVAKEQREKTTLVWCRWKSLKEVSGKRAESFLLGIGVANQPDLERTYQWNKRHEWREHWGPGIRVPRNKLLAEQRATEILGEFRRQTGERRFENSRRAALQSVPNVSKTTPLTKGVALVLLAVEVAKLVVEGIKAFQSPEQSPENNALLNDLKMKFALLQKAEEAEGRLLIPVLKVNVRGYEVMERATEDPFERNEQILGAFERHFEWEVKSVARDDYTERAELARTTYLSARVIVENLWPCHMPKKISFYDLFFTPPFLVNSWIVLTTTVVLPP